MLLLFIIPLFYFGYAFSGLNISAIGEENSPFSSSTPILPAPIESERLRWMKLVNEEYRAMLENYEQEHPWSEYLLECIKIVDRSFTGNKSWLVLSTKNVNDQSKSTLGHYYRTNMPVELKAVGQQGPSTSTAPVEPSSTPITVTGLIKGYYHNGQYVRDELRITMDHPNVGSDQRSPLIRVGDQFVIRRHLTRTQPSMRLLNDPKRWPEMPGFDTMLKVYECQKWSYPAPDPMIMDKSVTGSHLRFDKSQYAALAAALNPTRPIVAVHGGPGTGKTMLANEYIQLLAQNGQHVAVVCASNESMYALMELFVGDGQETFDQFLHYKYDERLANRVVTDPNAREIIQERSMVKILREETELGKRFGDLGQGSEEERVESVLAMKQHHRALLMRVSPVLFFTPGEAMLGLIEETQIKFDAVVVEQAGLINEMRTWMTILPLAPIVRLFGDYLQLTIPIFSSVARQEHFNRSLLERLDVEKTFCQRQQVNFHLSTQYRANPAIPLWSNRVLYKGNAAAPAPNVEYLRLEQLLVKPYGGDLVASPLLFVDTGKLEGGWQEWMFEPKHGGRSMYNLGEALVVAEHVKRLLKYGIKAKQIVYFTPFSAQQIQTSSLLAALNVQRPEQGPAFAQQMGPPVDFQAGEYDVVIVAFTVNPREVLRDAERDLRTLNHAFMRARRQVVVVANRTQLVQAVPEPMEVLLEIIAKHGRVLGPNEMLPLKISEDFDKIRRKANRMSRRGA